MELDGVDAVVPISKDPSGWRPRIMVYFLLPCDWVWKPGTVRHQRGQSVKLRRCCTNQDSALSQCNTRDYSGDKEIVENQCRLSEKRGHKTSLQSLAICLETREGTKNSQGFGYSMSAGAACHYGYDFRFKHCVSNGGANLNAADKRAGRTGLNLHFILIILFSTNKLTPEKT